MFRSTGLAAAVLALGLAACTGPEVQVTPLRPAPHALAPRAIETVQTYDKAPDDGVAVYRIEVTGGSQAELESALKTKAASLGCDGIVITLAPTAARTQGETSTGALNDHRVIDAAKASALCVIVPPRAG